MNRVSRVSVAGRMQRHMWRVAWATAPRCGPGLAVSRCHQGMQNSQVPDWCWAVVRQQHASPCSGCTSSRSRCTMIQRSSRGWATLAAFAASRQAFAALPELPLELPLLAGSSASSSELHLSAPALGLLLSLLPAQKPPVAGGFGGPPFCRTSSLSLPLSSRSSCSRGRGRERVYSAAEALRRLLVQGRVQAPRQPRHIRPRLQPAMARRRHQHQPGTICARPAPQAHLASGLQRAGAVARHLHHHIERANLERAAPRLGQRLQRWQRLRWRRRRHWILQQQWPCGMCSRSQGGLGRRGCVGTCAARRHAVRLMCAGRQAGRAGRQAGQAGQAHLGCSCRMAWGRAPELLRAAAAPPSSPAASPPAAAASAPVATCTNTGTASGMQRPGRAAAAAAGRPELPV